LGFAPLCLAVADFNGDGKPDILVSGDDTGQASGPPTKLFLGLGSGQFFITAGPDVGAHPAGPGAITVGDFNGDGKPDVALVRTNKVAVVLNESLPTLRITPLGLYNQITWSTMLGSGMVLQTTTNPADPTSWQAFPSPPVPFGPYHTGVGDWASGTSKFYRLVKP
jgi:hypothetical protein